jgi:hypothetical protein
MDGEQFADAVHAVTRDGRRILSRAIQHVIVEQENAILDSLDDRLDQDRIIILHDVIEIANQRGFAVNGLREIAARSRERLDEGRSAQATEAGDGVAALMPRRAMRAVAVVQEEIFTAERRHAGFPQNPACKEFVGRQCRGGRAVLRIPGASAGAEVKQPAARGDAEQQSRSAVEVAKRQSKFGAGEFRIDRLVRIEARFSLSKLSWASHAISFERFLIRRGHLLPDRYRIQQVNCARKR